MHSKSKQTSSPPPEEDLRDDSSCHSDLISYLISESDSNVHEHALIDP
jgi:hypothetical protein